MNLKDLTVSLCEIMSISGQEKLSSEGLLSIAKDYFDEYKIDDLGNHLFIKRCAKKNAPLIMIDAHFDEIGMLVKEIKDDGFLTVCAVGGLDSTIMQASRVVIYGKETIYGVISSTPPHLRSHEKEDTIEVEKLLIDTGYSGKALRELVEIGTPVGFEPVYHELMNDRITGKGLDNKACAATALYALTNTKKEELAGDVCLLLSCFEETARCGGVAPAAFSLLPDYAMVIDVNLARVPDTPKSDTVVMGDGVSVSISAVTDKRLTDMTVELCKEKNIKHQRIAAPSSTGTNATALNLVGGGVPVVDVGLPLKNMHTYTELVDLSDSAELSRLVKEFVCSKEIAEVFSK